MRPGFPFYRQPDPRLCLAGTCPCRAGIGRALGRTEGAGRTTGVWSLIRGFVAETGTANAGFAYGLIRVLPDIMTPPS